MYKYLGEGYLHGVPRRDLSEQEWRDLTDNQRSALRPYYVRTSKQAAEKRTDEELTAVFESGADPLVADTIEQISPQETESWQ
jgi:hypothetical protein